MLASKYIVKAGLDLLITFPLSPKSWNYRHAPPCLGKSLFLSLNSFVVELYHECCCVSLKSLWKKTYILGWGGGNQSLCVKVWGQRLRVGSSTWLRQPSLFHVYCSAMGSRLAGPWTLGQFCFCPSSHCKSAGVQETTTASSGLWDWTWVVRVARQTL